MNFEKWYSNSKLTDAFGFPSEPWQEETEMFWLWDSFAPVDCRRRLASVQLFATLQSHIPPSSYSLYFIYTIVTFGIWLLHTEVAYDTWYICGNCHCFPSTLPKNSHSISSLLRYCTVLAIVWSTGKYNCKLFYSSCSCGPKQYRNGTVLLTAESKTAVACMNGNGRHSTPFQCQQSHLLIPLRYNHIHIEIPRKPKAFTAPYDA